MQRLPIISISGRGFDKIMSARNRELLERVAGEQDVPWWQNKPMGPSTKYFLYLISPEEVGQDNDFGRAKNLFRLVKVTGYNEAILDEGNVEQEKILVQKNPTQREIWIKGAKLMDFFIVTPDEFQSAASAGDASNADPDFIAAVTDFKTRMKL